MKFKKEYFWISIGILCLLAFPFGTIIGCILIYSQYKKLKKVVKE